MFSKETNHLFRLIAVVMIVVILVRVLIETIILASEFTTNQIIIRIVGIIILGFIAYLIYRTQEGKKVSIISKIIGWIIAIFLILLGISGIGLGIFALTPNTIAFGIIMLIGGFGFLGIGIITIINLIKKK